MSQQLLLNPPKVSLKYFESRLINEGIDLIAGVDEAGRGCLAGPVVAASVILPANFSVPDLKDSKQLTAKQRDFFYDLILGESLAWSVSMAGPEVIDEINILQASLQAMKEAVLKLSMKPDFLLVDGPFPVDLNLPQKTLKKGDARSISIAAASIIAKVTRDRLMEEYGQAYPSFSFSIHKGYGTALHLKELEKSGPTPIHRMTFQPIKITNNQAPITK